MKQLMVRAAGLLSILAAVLPAPTFADDSGEALLHRVAVAGRQLSYSGIFVYRSGAREETSRIAHVVEGGRSRERIEVLDGSPREVLREGHSVRCFLPEENLLIIENQSRQRGFPSVLPLSANELSAVYLVRSGRTGRVAGIDSRILSLDPRDGYRYAHEFWVDPTTGLLLKAAMLSEKGEPIETFVFTQVTIGAEVAKESLQPKFDPRNLTVKQVDADELPEDGLPWSFRSVPPGYRLVSAVRRPGASGGKGDQLHVVFSDGLAAISVFIEQLSANLDEGMARLGPIHILKRRIDSHQAVVMGEVPALAVSLLGRGIERKSR